MAPHCLHDTDVGFRPGMKMSIRLSTGLNSKSLWLSLVWHFVPMSYIKRLRNPSKGDRDGLVPVRKSSGYRGNT